MFRTHARGDAVDDDDDKLAKAASHIFMRVLSHRPNKYLFDP